MNNFNSIGEAVGYYIDCGLEPIPLKPHSKEPFLPNWQNKDINKLWESYSYEVNIGLRCGGNSNFAVIDCDEKEKPGTFERILEYFHKLMIPVTSFPIAITSSGTGRHVYLRSSEPIRGNSTLLKPEIGSGEFRFGKGSYVVAPPSICSNQYIFTNGDCSMIPTLHPEDIQPLVNSCLSIKKESIDIPRSSLQLLKSKTLNGYETRSHKEQAIITGVLNKAKNENKQITVDDMYKIFKIYQPEKFMGKLFQGEHIAKKYLSISMDSAKTFIKNESDFRVLVKEKIQWASAIPWSGRTGLTDKAIYIAHAEIAYKKGSMPYHASCRDLALSANTTKDTAKNANKRLIEKNLINFERPSVAGLANVYSLVQIDTLPNEEPVRECINLVSNDAFRWGALNKSGYEIYSCLLRAEKPLTVKEIHNRTGIGLQTVRRGLGKMESITSVISGDVINMVTKVNGEWKANKIDLDLVAKFIGVFGSTEFRKEKFQKDRKKHQRDLILGSIRDREGNCQG